MKEVLRKWVKRNHELLEEIDGILNVYDRDIKKMPEEAYREFRLKQREMIVLEDCIRDIAQNLKNTADKIIKDLYNYDY